MRRRLSIIVTLVLAAVAVQAQETALPQDSTLHLPKTGALGQADYICSWPAASSLTGWQDWQLHSGLNMSLGASVFAGFGKYAPSGAGFAQNASGMYAWQLNGGKLSLALGGYLLNADWGGLHLRDTGLQAVMSYRFNDRWEGYLYGQKSLMRPKTVWSFFDAQEAGDRIGAAVRYHFHPSAYIQLSVEEHRGQPLFPYNPRF